MRTCLGLLLLGVFTIFGCILNPFLIWSTPVIDSQPDPFELTATQLIAQATQIAEQTPQTQVVSTLNPVYLTATALHDKIYGTSDPFALTATQLSVESTDDCSCRQTQQAANNGTPDPFQLTSTALIANATKVVETEQAQIYGTPDPFQLTATQLVRDATQQAQPSPTPFEFSTSQSEPDIFQLTATQLIAQATQETIFQQTETCSQIERNIRVIHGEIATDQSTINITSNGLGHTRHDWICDGEVYTTTEDDDYSIYIDTGELELTSALTISIIADVVQILADNPPEEVMTPPVTVFLTIASHSTSFKYWDGHFSYEEAIAAYKSGLRGQALLDALDIEVPD